MNLLRIFLIVFSLTCLTVACVRSIKTSNQSDLSLNHIQVLGSHNSYKKPLTPAAKAFLEERDPSRAFAYDYSHPSIEEQLDSGLRHLELDVVIDYRGGRFIEPYVQSLGGEEVFSKNEKLLHGVAGFKVLHEPDIDIQTHCILFAQCLSDLRVWSNSHPNHLPIFILINAKENGAHDRYGVGAQVSKFQETDFDQLDNVIFSELKNKLITPDDVRGDHTSLRTAVLNSGWPSLNDSRGKFIFIFDGNSTQRELYRVGRPSLKSRAMFASYSEYEDEAAIMILNDPIQNQSKIQRIIKKGFLVRTRSDDGNKDAKNKNYLRIDAAIASGAQIISTDLYPGSPQVERFGLAVSFDNGNVINCNRSFSLDSCAIDDYFLAAPNTTESGGRKTK